jgi:iron complex outermembrane receptor protein
MKRVLLMMLACVSLLGITRAQWDLSVTVKNQNGEFLSDATVVIQGTYWLNTTDVRGECKFAKLPGGNYLLKVSHLGYKDFTEEVNLKDNQHIDVVMNEVSFITEEVVIKGVRAENDQPATFTVLQKDNLDKRNFGQDVPYLLSMEPSVVTTSDAGMGIGYTAMRIRGLDDKKINVSINGIPYNDAESHGVYWVDVPDMASSIKSIQIQRGLGKSGTGPGSFGASINIETNQIPLKPYAITDNSFGSYNTMKNTIQAGTGLINGHWFAEGRFSRIGSDGYIDRASSKLRSYFAQAGYYNDKSILRIIAFGGFEETYQAWYGIDSASINSLGRTYNWAGYYYKNGQDNFYNKEVDHYTQNHFQLNYTHMFRKNVSFNTVINYTHGAGYYQEYYSQASFSNYLLPDIIQGTDTTKTSDLVGRKWLDNNLIAGNTFVSWNSNALTLTYGVGFSDYFKAKHFGEIIWSDIPNSEVNGNKFYSNQGDKADISTYAKMNYKFAGKGNLYLDVNYRFINYKASGVDRESGNEIQLDLNKTYNFINPIIGVSYSLPSIGLAYVTAGASNREPRRSDFINNYNLQDELKPETMYNTEIGLRNSLPNTFYELNFYYMLYRNELIKTGQLDNVGSPVLKNAGKSRRYGIELNAGSNLTSYLMLRGNLTLSQNKTDFKDYINNNWTFHNNVDISFSPRIIGAAEIIIKPTKFLEMALTNKYVGKQYLDNTQDKRRMLNAYNINNFRVNIKTGFNALKRMELKLLVNNIFNVKYNANGYMYGDTPYYYPQALRNFLAGISLEF